MLTFKLQSRSNVSARALRQCRSAHSKATVCIVGAGTAGVTVAAQLQRAWQAEGRQLAKEPGSIAIIDEAKEHHCEPHKVLGFLGRRVDTSLHDTDQPGWTLV